VIITIFKYIELLKRDGVQERIFSEVQSLASLAFQFKEKYPPSQYTSRLAGLMQHGYPSENILSGPSLIRRYDPDLIRENLDCLRPDRFRIMLASQNPPSGVEYTERERWYNTEYSVHDFSSELKEVKKMKPL
jgi:insulysin